MGNIVLLDDLTINQIAAGEVIERPASVIKEMVENSIDAGSTNITVEIKNGGISFIKVADNGKGIAQDDLEIAFERHATSKIRSANDLDTVTSMGFRGEALASIAAVSNIEMISKTEEQDNGYKVVVEAGNILEKEIAASSIGTTIIVRNLFFNTPVRYKFLKKDYTESGYIEDVITRIALVHPHIAIKLINSGKTIIQTNGNGDLKTVIYSIYGKNVAEACMPVTYTYEDIKIDGMIGKANIARSNRANQLFFVNKRYIKDRTLTSATEQAYKGMIPLGKFGFVILNITMNPAKVDVNVHPAKLEVRFQEEGKIFQAIYHSIKDTLLKNGENTGLFGLRNTDENKIKEYTDNESKINTNMQPIKNEQINTLKSEKNEKQKSQFIESFTDAHNLLGIEPGGPINTNDILEQLKKMKEDLQKEQIETNMTQEMKEEQVNTEEQLESIIKEVEEPIVKESEQKLEQEQCENKELEEQEKKVENIKIEQDEINGEVEVEIEKQEEEEQIQEQEMSEDTEEVLQEKVQKITSTIDRLLELKDVENKLKDSQQEDNDENNFDEMYEKLFGKAPIKTSKKQEDNVITDMLQNSVSMFDEIEEYKKQPYKIVGIVFNTYVIIEMNQEMYIIDQHAAHERVLYEKVKQNYYNDASKDSQMLLLPDIITLTHKEMDIAKENMDMFYKAGFELEEFGENTFKLTGVPTICIDLDNKELFLETLDEINTVARTAKQEKEEKFIATVACKAAVKANMELTIAEIESLIEKMLELPNPFSCPHGRPTAIKMTKYDIERKFARK